MIYKGKKTFKPSELEKGEPKFLDNQIWKVLPNFWFGNKQWRLHIYFKSLSSNYLQMLYGNLFCIATLTMINSLTLLSFMSN